MSVRSRARLAMTQRAYLERFTPASVDASGDPTQSWSSLSTTPCRVLRNDEKPVLSEGNQRYVETFRVMVPDTTDVTTKDRVLKITDRASTPAKLFGETDNDGTTDIAITIDAIIPRHDAKVLVLRNEGSGLRAS